MFIPLPGNHFPMYPEELRYRVQVFVDNAWDWEDNYIYSLAELNDMRRGANFRDSRGVKVSWANPRVVHSVIWFKKGS